MLTWLMKTRIKVVCIMCSKRFQNKSVELFSGFLKKRSKSKIIRSRDQEKEHQQNFCGV